MLKIANMISHFPKLFKNMPWKSFMTTSMGSSSKSHIFIVMSIIIILMVMKYLDCDKSSCSSSSCSSDSSSSCSSDSSSSCSSCCSSDSSSSCSSDSSSSCSSDSSSSCSSDSSDSSCSSDHKIKKDCKCKDKNKCNKKCNIEPYDCTCKQEVCGKYNKYVCSQKCNLSYVVKSSQLCIPQYVLRTVPYCLDFYYTFNVCGITNATINSMIILRDLLQWMTSGVSLTEDILPDKLYPVIFITKDGNGNLCCNEYLKIFISTDECNTRTAFVSKGTDYMCVYSKINKLLVGCDDCPLIFDLLNGNEYYTYNITDSCPVSLLQFLTAFLSLYLLPDCLIGKTIKFDLSYCNETKLQLEYFYEYFNCDCNPSTVIS